MIFYLPGTHLTLSIVKTEIKSFEWAFVFKLPFRRTFNNRIDQDKVCLMGKKVVPFKNNR